MDKQVLLVMTKCELDAIIDERIAMAMASFGTERKQNLVSRTDAAQRLAVSETTLWRWEREHRLKPIKIARKVYYREKELSLIEGGEQ